MSSARRAAVAMLVPLAVAASVRAEHARNPDLILDLATLMELERSGLAFGAQLGAPGESGRDLMRSGRYRSLVSVLSGDLDELSRRPSLVRNPLDKPFDPRWLTSARARFELVGVIDRLDRRPLDGRCGVARLTYRLALAPPRRPITRLPMTVSLLYSQPGAGGCGNLARRWLSIPSAGPARVQEVRALIASLGSVAQAEVNLQTVHGPATGNDKDDHAEYLLRAFDVWPARVIPRLLLNTPQRDLDAAQVRQLRRWVVEHFREIDAGTAVVPAPFLAFRALSVAPRGLARAENRLFTELFGARVGTPLPYSSTMVVKSEAALLRRLDQLTCVGCHQTSSIAGFHLLGEDRDPDARFNTLAAPASPHVGAELAWRRRFLEAAAKDERFVEPRPYADRRDGGYGAHCGLGDPGFAAWTCGAGLRCRDLDGDVVGSCLPDDGNHWGDACQTVRIARPALATAPIIPGPIEPCALTPGGDPGLAGCTPNNFGFPGGFCSEPCGAPGDRDGDSVCTGLPAAGYEADCLTKRAPVEGCLARHRMLRRVRACASDAPCRDGYACARVSGLPPTAGACIPPYFLFQLRVDGPRLDR